ncbi:MAG TPA: T9SS type A sorting domain-containing protein [Chryseosolibacter sp.]
MTLCTKLPFYFFLFCVLQVVIITHASAQCSNTPSINNTETISSITSTSAVLGGNITAIPAGGGCVITERGISWSTVSVNDAELLGGGSSTKVAQTGSFSSTGSFTVSVTGLPPADQIYFVVYAINSNGTTITNGENFYTHATTPGQASGITKISATESSITVGFPAASTLTPAPSANGGYLYYRSTGAISPTLTNGTGYSTANPFRTEIPTTDTQITATTGVTAETGYNFAIIPYDWDNSNPGTYAYNTVGYPTATFYTLGAELTEQPNAVLTATATSPINIDLDFPAIDNNGISGDEGYVILRNLGAAATVGSLVDGQDPSSLPQYVGMVTTNGVTEFADGTVLPGQTYHYAIIPFTWATGNYETINFKTNAGGTHPIRTASASTPLSTVTVAGFVTAPTNGLSMNFIGSENNQVIIGFSINSTNGPSTLNSVNIHINNDPTGVLTNFELFESSNSTYDGTGSKGTVAPAAGVLSWTVNNALATGVPEYYYLVADIPAGANPATTFNFLVANADLSVTGGTVGGGPFNRTITVDKLTASFVTGSGAVTSAIGSAANQKILSVAASSNLSQTLQKLVFDFNVDVDPILNTGSFALKIAGTPVSGASYSYDIPTKKLTVTNINTVISSAVTFDLHADVLPSAMSGFIVNLDVANNPADNSATTVDAGYVNNFTTITNTVTITPLEATFAPGAGAITNGVTGTANQKILALTASSNGTQTLQKLVFDFDADVATTLNTSTFALRIGGTAVATATYSYDGPTAKLTVSNINTAISTPVNFDLHADVLIGATSGFTVNLTSANNPTDNSASTVNAGLVDNFATISNAVGITPLQANFVSSGTAITSVVGGTNNQIILGVTASSNGDQTLQKLVFNFNTDISTILTTGSFLLRIGGVTVPTATYSYSAQKLTVSNINTSISSPVNFDLHVNFRPDATTGFTVSLETADNPTNNSASTVNQGTLVNFAAINNAITVTPLTANFLVNGGATSTVIAGNTNQKILALTASSNGIQTLQKLVFDFDVDVATIVNTTTFAVKIAGTPIGGAVYTYDGTAKTLTVTTLATSITAPKNLDLHVDILPSATANFTVNLAVGNNPTNNSAGTLNRGFVANFAMITNAIAVTKLEAGFAAVAGAAANAVGGNTNVKLLSFSAAATTGGTQTLQSLVFDFDAEVSTTYTNFLLKNGGVTVGTASYNSGTSRLTVSSINQSIAASQTLDIFADVLPGADNGTITLSLSNTYNPTDNSASTVDRGYVATFGAISNAVTITALTATINPVTGGAVLATAGALEAGTNNRALFGLSMSSNGTQALNSITFNLTNQPDGFTNFRLFKGTVGAMGVSVASAADPGAGVNTITFTPAAVSISSTTDYFYLVADVKGLATVNSNSVTVNIAPMTLALTLGSGKKDIGANPATFTGNTYSAVSSTNTVIANNNGETTPINFAIYSTKIATAGLSTGNAQKLYSITVGGPDADAHPTVIRQLQFSVTNLQNLASVALLTNAGGTNIAEVNVSSQTGTQTVNFGDGVSTLLSVNDNTTVTLDIYATFRSGVNDRLGDNDIIQFTYGGATTDGIASAISTAAGSVNSNATKNNIHVVATVLNVRTLNMAMQPITKANPNSTFRVIATAEDARGNIDIDKVNTATLDFSDPNPSVNEDITPSGPTAWNNGLISWTAAIAPADIYDLTVTDNEPVNPPTNNGLGSITFDFQIESLGTTIDGVDLQSCQVGAADSYTNLPDLTLTETDPGDFQPGTNLTFLLILPTGWQFQLPSSAGYAAPAITYTPAKNFTSATFANFIGNNIAKFTYSVTGTAQADQMIISGLKVKNVNASGTTVAKDSVMRSGTGVIIGADETKAMGYLTLPVAQPALQIAVEAQPGQTPIPASQRVFGVDDPAFIMNAQVGGNTVPVADVVFSGNGVSRRLIGGTINADRYLFTPTAVNAVTVPVTFVYTNPNTKCRFTLTDNITVRNVAITGLEDGSFCTNDSQVNPLGVASADIPTNYKVYDFTYRDEKFAVTKTITNTTDLSTTELRLNTGPVGSSTPAVLQTQTVKTITAITMNPNLKPNAFYDFSCIYGCYFQTRSETNPVIGSDIYTTTSFIRLTIPDHGYTAGSSKIFINGYIDWFYPQPISFREFTVYSVVDSDNIIINVAEGYVAYNVDYGYSEFYVQQDGPYNVPVYLVNQSFNPLIDFRIPGHGFVTGDRIELRGFRNFSPYFDGQLFTVTKLDANYIRVNLQEYFGTGLTTIFASWFGETFRIIPDTNIPLPGYVHDLTAPYPHKGAARSTYANSQFVPDVWSLNWGDRDVTISARIIPSACATAGPGCRPTVEHNVTVDLVAPPTVDFIGLEAEYCAVAPGSPIVLTAANDLFGTFSGDGVTDNSDATAQFNPLDVDVVKDVPFNVTLAYTGPSGCSNTISKPVIVRSLPVIDIGSPLIEICEGSSTPLGNTPLVTTGNGPVYFWTNGASLDNATLENPTASPIATTIYQVTVTDRFGCQQTDQVTVVPFDAVVANANGPAAICGQPGAEIPLGTSSITGALSTGTWSTTAAGQFLDVNNAPTTNFGDAVKFVPTDTVGVVTLTLTSDVPGTGVCPSDDDDLVVNINQRAVMKAGADFEVCASDQVIVKDAKIYGSATGVTWDVLSGTGTIPTAVLINPEYVPSVNEKTFGSTVILRATTNIPNSVCPAATDNVSVTISQRALISAGADFARCQDQTITLSGSVPANSSAGQVVGVSPYNWTVNGSSARFSDPTVANPVYTPDPSEYGTTVTMRVTSDDPLNACGVEFDEVQVIINTKPDALPSVTYPSICVGQPINPFTASGLDIKWYENADLSGTNFTGSPFTVPQFSDTDKVINYYVTTTSSQGCESLPSLHSLTVNANPVAAFTSINECLNDLTELNAETSSVTYTAAGLSGGISNWVWDFGHDRSGEQITGTQPEDGNTVHKFPEVGTYTVGLTVTTIHGCSNSTTKQVRIGAIPTPTFTYRYICEGDNTEFTANAGALLSSEIASYNWDFGTTDFTSALPNPTQVGAPVIQFGSASMTDAYEVNLTITSDKGCIGTAKRFVPILPLKSVGFAESFEKGSRGWAVIGFPQDDRHSWKLPISMTANHTIKAASDSSRAWVISNAASATEARAIYYDNERSALNSPCIDLTGVDRPVISFDYWLDLDEADGVYMETSSDGGVTWNRLGNRNEGLGWYNHEDILGLSVQSTVGQPFIQMGWSGEETGWKQAKFSLDDFKDQTRLRLRFVFGSNSDNPLRDLDGFGLDNFELGTRNRIVLLENFTNSSEGTNNTNFQNFAPALTNTELVKMQYHTNLGGTIDDINRQNPTDPNARAAFYGLTNGTNVIPRVFLDGVSQGGFVPSANWAETQLSTRALAIAPFELSVESVKAANGGVEVKTTIKAGNTTAYTTERLALFVAVLEKDVDGNAFVLRKMLPDAGGRALPLPISPGQSIPMESTTWLVDIDGMDVNNLAVVAFIQDLDNNRDVLQAAIDITPEAPTATTGIDGMSDRFFSVYPSPADQHMTVTLSESATEKTSLKLYDQVGKVVNEASFEKGDNSKTLDTRAHAAGVYLLQVETSKGILTRKVMVLHGR